jgi:hypothetical protein
MDFFRALDSVRIVGFKTEVMNLLTTKTLTRPATLNDMYILANQWFKTNTKMPSSLATTFVMVGTPPQQTPWWQSTKAAWRKRQNKQRTPG